MEIRPAMPMKNMAEEPINTKQVIIMSKETL